MRGFGLVGRGCLSGHPQAERLITGACLSEAPFFICLLCRNHQGSGSVTISLDV